MYHANCNGQQIKSHLDRIYMSSAAARHTYGWKICQTAVLTDHWMVLAKYALAEALYIRKGHWTWQLLSLKSKPLMKLVIERGKRLQEDIMQAQRNGTDQEITNPQTLQKSFKNDIREVAQKHNKVSWAKITKRMGAIRNDMDELTNKPNLDTKGDTHYNEAFLTNELAHVEKSRQGTTETSDVNEYTCQYSFGCSASSIGHMDAKI
jgi:hypothetical protein